MPLLRRSSRLSSKREASASSPYTAYDAGVPAPSYEPHHDHDLNSSIPAPYPSQRARAPRPPNPFIVFRREYSKNYSSKEEQSDQQNISIKAGLAWRGMSEEMRMPYVQQAEREKLLHMQKWPEYKFRPERKCGGLNPKRRKSKSRKGYERGLGVAAESSWEHGEPRPNGFKLLCDWTPEDSGEANSPYGPTTKGEDAYAASIGCTSEVMLSEDDIKRRGTIRAGLLRPGFSQRTVPDLQPSSLSTIKQTLLPPFHEDSYPLTPEAKLTAPTLDLDPKSGVEDDIDRWFDFPMFDMK